MGGARSHFGSSLTTKKVVGLETICIRSKVHIANAMAQYKERAANAALLPNMLLEFGVVLSSFAAHPPTLTSSTWLQYRSPVGC